MTNTAKHANSQRHPLSPAERAAKLLALKPMSYFNAPIRPAVLLGTSANCKAKAAI